VHRDVGDPVVVGVGHDRRAAVLVLDHRGVVVAVPVEVDVLLDGVLLAVDVDGQLVLGPRAVGEVLDVVIRHVHGPAPSER
jgi:hypothetical protein